MYKLVNDKVIFEYDIVKSETDEINFETFETNLYIHYVQKNYVDFNKMIWCPVCGEDTDYPYPIAESFSYIHDICNTKLFFSDQYISVFKDKNV